MIPRTLPGRITAGFILLLLITLLIGGISLWSVFGINQHIRIMVFIRHCQGGGQSGRA